MARRRKSVVYRDRKPHVLAVTAMLTAAARYCRAAERDERYGYSLAAAFEWREAAELLAPMPAIADQCWKQWERLMRLPRSLAAPFGAECYRVTTSAICQRARRWSPRLVPRLFVFFLHYHGLLSSLSCDAAKQPRAEPGRHVEAALVTDQAHHIAGTVENGPAVAAAREMRLHVGAEIGVQYVVQVTGKRP